MIWNFIWFEHDSPAPIWVMLQPVTIEILVNAWNAHEFHEFPKLFVFQTSVPVAFSVETEKGIELATFCCCCCFFFRKKNEVRWRNKNRNITRTTRSLDDNHWYKHHHAPIKLYSSLEVWRATRNKLRNTMKRRSNGMICLILFCRVEKFLLIVFG